MNGPEVFAMVELFLGMKLAEESSDNNGNTFSSFYHDVLPERQSHGHDASSFSGCVRTYENKQVA